MTATNRILSAEPVGSLKAYLSVRGGAGLKAARAVAPDVVVAELEAAGLRGRGGAGFATGTKWRTVLEAPKQPTTVVVNGAEGEPGTFKDRAIIANNPYQVIEGALIAAAVIGATNVIFAMKADTPEPVARMRAAVDEITAAGWPDSVTLSVFEGPEEYLYGEETALLQALHDEPPFPQVTPPFRDAPPELIDNVETMANVPGIVLNGAKWFRAFGTQESPGTIVCTVSGSVTHAGVGEFAMGTPLSEVIQAVGGGGHDGQPVKAVMPGVSGALVPAGALDTPLSYEGFTAIGSGLGSAGFVVLTENDDVPAAVAGASRFLAVESCGQCTPCKQDGLALAQKLELLARSEATADDVHDIQALVRTVADEARCSLARQHEAIVASLFHSFENDVDAHVAGDSEAAEPLLVAELVSIEGGVAVLNERHADKQPDWTYEPTDSGKAPAERLAERRDARQLGAS